MKTARWFLICLLVVALIAIAWRVARTRAFHRAGPPAAAQRLAAVPEKATPLPGVQQASGSRSSASAPATSAGVVEETVTEQRLGPFTISGNNYTVVLHHKHLAASADTAATDGVVAMEIVDTTGAVLYQRTYPLWADAEGVSAWTIFADTLKGTNGTGLLVKSRPSESSGFYEQILGVVNGKLVPFCGPFPGMDLKPDASGVYRTEGPLGPQADEIRVAIGTGRFVITIPIRLDWAQGKLALAPQCPELSAGNAHALCQYQLKDPNSYLKRPKDVTFVRLYSSPDERSGRAERVVVKPASQIDILAYSADMEMNQPDPSHPPSTTEFPVKDMVQIGVDPNTEAWLQVRIDGKVGWIHGDEDFTALGLPGPEDQIDPL